MKHKESLFPRLFYLLGVFISLVIIFKYSEIALNLQFYGLFIFLILGYYLLDLLNFQREYKSKDFILSTIINGFVFYVFVLFYKERILVLDFFIYNMIQNVFKKFLNKVFYNKKKTASLFGESEKIKEILEKSSRYDFKGIITAEELNDFNEDKLIYVGNIEDDSTVKKIVKLKLRGVQVVDDITFRERVEGKVDIENIDRNWILKSSGFEILNNSVEQRIKRAFDLSAAGIVFLCSFPFIIFTYILVKMDNPKNFLKNPAFFKQSRIGEGGEEFMIVKFRSMKLHDPNEHSKYASKNDNRITKVGKFIRKTRLDELPQLWNVFCGDMSFVGPRPEWNVLGRDYEEKIKHYRLRYSVKPGLTGWAQVMYPYGANLEDTKRKLEYDIYYIKHQNFVMDIIIFFKTVKTVVFGKGM